MQSTTSFFLSKKVLFRNLFLFFICYVVISYILYKTQYVRTIVHYKKEIDITSLDYKGFLNLLFSPYFALFFFANPVFIKFLSRYKDNSVQLKISQEGLWTKEYNLLQWNDFVTACVNLTSINIKTKGNKDYCINLSVLENREQIKDIIHLYANEFHFSESDPIVEAENKKGPKGFLFEILKLFLIAVGVVIFLLLWVVFHTYNFQ